MSHINAISKARLHANQEHTSTKKPLIVSGGIDGVEWKMSIDTMGAAMTQWVTDHSVPPKCGIPIPGSVKHATSI